MWPKANFDQISFSKILTNKYHHVKVQAESFHLNGHIMGFRLQTQKLDSRYKTPSNTLAVKGLRWALSGPRGVRLQVRLQEMTTSDS